MPRILGIVVTFNGEPWIERCLGSLRDEGADIFVVDNGSTDATVRTIEDNFPEAILKKCPENPGFGAANNIGLSYALAKGYDFVYLLNQDAWLNPGTLGKLAGSFSDDYGILSPVQTDAEGRLDRIFEQKCGRYLKAGQTVCEVPFAMAAHWMLSAEAIRRTGGFSPTFHQYGEDNDYISRLHFHGLKVGIVNNATAVHDRAARAIDKAYRMKRKYVIAAAGISNPSLPPAVSVPLELSRLIGAALANLSLIPLTHISPLLSNLKVMLANREQARQRHAFLPKTLIINQPLCNRGDESAHRAFLHSLLDLYPRNEFTVLFLDANQSDIDGFDVNLPNVRYENLHTGRFFYKFAVGSLKRGLPSLCCLHPQISRLSRYIASFDNVIMAPGGMDLGGFRSWPSLFLLRLCEKANPDCAVFARSIGPFVSDDKESSRFNKYALDALRDSNFLSLRDEKSCAIARENGLQYVSTIDSAFLEQPDAENPYPGDYCVLVPNRLCWHPAFKDIDEEDVSTFFANLIKDIRSRFPDTEIYLLPQLFGTQDDRSFFLETARLSACERVTILGSDIPSDCQQAIIKGARFVIGARYHSIVFAINNDTPFVALNYEHKMNGLLEALGLEERGVDITQELDVDKVMAKISEDRPAAAERAREIAGAGMEAFAGRDSGKKDGSICGSSRRIVRNTALLYFRMLFLMLVGLFTSRVVLASLGVEDFGIYSAVGGIVMMFTLVTASITQAISRYLTFELGKNDSEKLKRVFSTSVIVQLILCAVVVIICETLGVWFLNSRMNIPPERLTAANWVLQCTMGVLLMTLLSVPFNSTIIAHEKMGAFAGISILEAILKLSVALAIMSCGADKLKVYAALMLLVAIIVRGAYALYCRYHFEEVSGSLRFDGKLVKEMSKFAGWNFFGTAGYIVNTQGITILVNIFFGVGINAARGVTMQVENIVRQFVTNFLTAVNPQITKSYAAGDMRYCNTLVFKGAKFSYLIILFFTIPLFLECDILLRLWLGNVPEHTATFVRLMLLGLMADMLGNSLAFLEMATGDIRKYYLIIGSVSLLVFILSWVAFVAGASPEVSYVIFAAIYLVMLALKLAILRRQIGFPVGDFIREVILKILPVTLAAGAVSTGVRYLMDPGIARLLVVGAVSVISVVGFTYLFATTQGERDYVKSNILRHGKA